MHRDLPPFRDRAMKMQKAKADQALRMADPKCKDKSLHLAKPKYWTERCQLALGDRSNQREAIEKDNWNFGHDGRAAQKVYKKIPYQVGLQP